MAILQGARASKRPVYIRRAFASSVRRGTTLVTKWPRKKPKRPTEYRTSLQRRMRFIERWLRALHPRETTPTKDAFVAYNKSVKGQRGSATARYEDYETQRANGRAFEFILPDGTHLYSAAQAQDISDILDWLSDTPGSVLCRGNRWWTAALACTPNRRLTMVDTTTATGCCGHQPTYRQEP